MKGWRLFYQNPLGLDLEWTNGVPYICIYFLFFLLKCIVADLQINNRLGFALVRVSLLIIDSLQ